MTTSATTATRPDVDTRHILASTVLNRVSKIDNCVNLSILMLRQSFAPADCPAGGRAHQAASRLADTLAVMRVEFELLHAELVQGRGSLNEWIEDEASQVLHGERP